MAEQLTIEPQPDAAPQIATDAGEAPRGRKKSGKKRAKKKTAKKAAKKKASKKTGKKSGKRGSKKAAKRKSTRKAKSGSCANGCTGVMHVMPYREAGGPLPDEPGPLVLRPGGGVIEAQRRRRRAVVAGTAAAAVVVGGIYLLVSRRARAAGPVHEPIEEEAGVKQLPPPIDMGKIPPLYTRVYQLFDRFVEGGAEFFANVADGESGHNFAATNPKGVSLSRAGVERQMKHASYGKEWDGKGPVPFTAYLEPDKAKALPAMGLFQGVAGTIGQAGRRNGTAILAPLPVARWSEPALQLAAFMELFGSLYMNFGADTPEKMRIAWGLPSKATKPDDPYYVSRAKKWAERQKKTGVPIEEFGAMTLMDYSVEEVVAYFSQFDYSPFATQTRSRAVTPAYAFAPLASEVTERLQAQMDLNPAFVGSDFGD